MNKNEYFNIAKHILDQEAKAILDLKALLSEDFIKAVDLIFSTKGRLVITGMGKSGHIGNKIAATLASTGTPSFFMHPAEAIHGDLGMLTKDDILLAISNSGESDEILRIIPIIKTMGIKLIGMAGNPRSSLAQESDCFLDISIKHKACPLDLAPMSSTTATLAMGDALAGVLMKKRDFKPQDFAMFHPGGSLGKRLLTRVKDIMHKKNLPIVALEDSAVQIIDTITQGRLGICVVVDNKHIQGIVTDGDLRRALAKNHTLNFTAKDIMTKEPKKISSNAMATEAEEMMHEHKITNLLVVDNANTIEGIVQLYAIGGK